MSRAPEIVVFDLGGVLFDWDPRYLYRHLFADPAEMERFLAEICNHDWNIRMDAGRTFAEGVAELQARHPELAELISAYFDRWPEMLKGAFDDTVAVLEELHVGGVPLYALTNWSAETFPHARAYKFMDRFRAIVVSGEEGVAKPDPAIYGILLGRIGAPAQACLFIDDNALNVEAACALGMHGHHFRGAAALRGELVGYGLLPDDPA